jgi:putative salt-induced outer membrane protein
MKKFVLGIAGVFLCSITVQVTAQEGNGLNTQIELGAIFTSGNTEDENIQFQGNISWLRNSWEHGFSVDGFRSSKDGELAAQRVYYVANSNYSLTESSFILTRIAHDDDRFSGYDSQSDISLNYGRNLLTNMPNMAITLNLGLGMRQSRSEEDSFDEPMLRLASDYEWNISQNANFVQHLSTETGDKTSIFRSESSIETKILDNLSLKFSVNVKHQTEVPVGRQKTDTETAITFVLDF